MRKQQSHYLLLGCAFGAQLLCATKGYSNNIGYADANLTGKANPANVFYAGKSGRKGSPKFSNKTDKAFDKISGKVTDAEGKPVYGATVQIKGSKNAVLTNTDGVFTITAASGDVLVITSVGYDAKEVPVSGDHLEVILAVTSRQLNEVVVTALGIQHLSKDLTYSAQKITNSDLTTVKDLNFINSLSGKVAGVTITKSSSGVGGSSRVILRGNKSTRANDPLYVVDGIPLQNYRAQQPTDVWGQSSGSGVAGSDGGDGISNINPDDIESMTILKGASGAALYGSAAANGVILITTKSGKAGRMHINLFFRYNCRNACLLPTFAI